MNKIRRAAVGATAALAVLVPAGVTYAATSGGRDQPATGSNTSPASSTDHWQRAHDRLVAARQKRVQTLAKLTSSVNSHKTLSAQDKRTLTDLLSKETTGINQLLAQVQAANPQTTSLAQLRADAKDMVDQYRVYLVMGRQVHLTEAADAETAAETRIENREARIQAAIAKHGNPADAVQAYDDLVAQVSHATQATGNANIPAVLAVTPQGYPTDAGPLASARADLGQARTDLQAARGDLVTIKNVLTQHASKVKPAPAANGSSASA